MGLEKNASECYVIVKTHHFSYISVDVLEKRVWSKEDMDLNTGYVDLEMFNLEQVP